jgi:peptidyl-tRNA hydrolase, PTH1 family
MGIIQKNPLDGMASQFYTVGLSQTALVVGLGNIGSQYDNTRHNVGFACIDTFAELNGFDPWVEKRDLKCLYTSHNLGATRVITIKPTTLMNLSGEAVQAVMHFYKIGPAQVIIVHDDLDIPFGQIRTRTGGSDAGHNGIKSVTEHIGEAYGRIRVGIGPKTPEQMDSADFVLARFSGPEMSHMKDLTREVSAILNEYIFGGQLQHETRTFIV